MNQASILISRYGVLGMLYYEMKALEAFSLASEQQRYETLRMPDCMSCSTSSQNGVSVNFGR